MKGIADYIHSLGLKAGIYSEAGANSRTETQAFWDGDKNGIGVGLYGFEHQDANLFFNEWGFDFIKIDYCGAGQQLDLEGQKDIRKLSMPSAKFVHDTAEYKTVVEICQIYNRQKSVSLSLCR